VCSVYSVVKSRSVTFAFFVFFVAIGSGCASPARLTAPGADHVGEILAHPEAPAVARGHPAFFRFVANKVADLTHDLSISESGK
jgi:hypothetical protein